MSERPEGSAPPARFADRLLSGLARLLTRVFFRRVEVEGAWRAPTTGPVLYVSNHGNSLVDPMLLVAVLPPGLRFLAKSTLWKHPVVKYLVRWADAVPVYRHRDEGVDTSRNEEMFARVWRELAGGAAITLFPEGTSHEEPRLLPLKTGAARIALGAEERHGPFELSILPVGLVYSDRERFRSEALVHLGEPVLVRDAGGGVEDREAVRELTEQIEAALADVTLSYESWDAARRIERAADLYLKPSLEAPTRGTLAERFRARHAFSEGYREMARHHPGEVRAVVRAVDHYDRLLRLTGLRDDQVASTYRPHLVARFVGRTLFMLLVRLPLAALGALINWLPYRLPGWITRMLRRPQGERATYKIMMGLVLFPLFWGAAIALASRLWGPWAGVGMALVAPASGVAALLSAEQWRIFVAESRAWLLLRGRPRLASLIKRRRQEVSAAVERLVALYQSG